MTVVLGSVGPELPSDGSVSFVLENVVAEVASDGVAVIEDVGEAWLVVDSMGTTAKGSSILCCTDAKDCDLTTGLAIDKVILDLLILVRDGTVPLRYEGFVPCPCRWCTPLGYGCDPLLRGPASAIDDKRSWNRRYLICISDVKE